MGLGLAFDAPDGEALAAEALAKVPPEAWPVLTFDLHPSLNVFHLSHDVGPFQQAVRPGRRPGRGAGDVGGASDLAAWRMRKR